MIEDIINRHITDQLRTLKLELRAELLKEIGVGASPWMTRKEASNYLGVSIASIDNYVRWGVLEKYKIDRSTRFKRSDLDKLLY
jgi:excisionase family DNA binding protein